jgi:hypothetical protein
MIRLPLGSPTTLADHLRQFYCRTLPERRGVGPGTTPTQTLQRRKRDRAAPGHPLLAQFLVSKGVSLDTPEGEGKTPVERAEEIAADHPDYDAAPAENEPRENERPQK